MSNGGGESVTGKQHATVSTITASVTVLASPALTRLVGYDAVMGLIAGAIVGILVTPDIDHHVITYEENRIKRWCNLCGKIWIIYWLPYSKAFKHRGISHAPIVGTMTRALYFPLPVIVAGWFGIASVVGLLAGWALQDLLHIAGDR